MDNINYHWLKTEEEKRFVLDYILSVFQNRKPTGLESVETMAEKVLEDEDVNSAEKILRGLPHICTTIWKDDIYESETYAIALRSMLEIAPDICATIDIDDGSADTVKGDEFDVSVLSGGHEHRVTLLHQRFLDYGFLKLILQLLETENGKGKYYSVNCESVEDGFVFVYLEAEEYSELVSFEMFDLYELNAYEVEQIASIYNKVEASNRKTTSIPESSDTIKKSMDMAAVEESLHDNENLKVEIHFECVGAAHEYEHGYREVMVDPEMNLDSFIQLALGFKESFLASEYYMLAAKQLCAIIRRTNSGSEIISKENIFLRDLVIKNQPLKVSFNINKLNDATIEYRLKDLIAKGVERLDNVEAAWLGAPVGTPVDNLPYKLADSPTIGAMLQDHNSANEETPKKHWIYKLGFILRFIRVLMNLAR